MMKINHAPVMIALLLLLCTQATFASPEIPGADQKTPVALVGGTIHPVSGPDIPSGTLLFDRGRIVAVGDGVDIPEASRRIDLAGKHIYPGLIDAATNIGLVEINAVRATRDARETGSINPNVKAWVAVNPDSEIIPVTRSGGVLLCLTAPQGGLIAGTSALLQLDGWTWEDMTVTAPVAMHIHWPTMVPVSTWWMKKTNKEQMKERDKQLEALARAFDDARAYGKAKGAAAGGAANRQKSDARWEAMIGVLEGKLPLIVAADEIQQIQAAVAFAQRQKVKLIIYGGYDAPHAAELLKKHDVAVIVGGVYRLPRRRWDNYDAPFTLPERLRAAGVRFCISGSRQFGASNVRNLPYHAATASAYGLPRQEALKAITLNAAQILGVADRLGSLQAGKDATLIITDGDPLETPTHVLAAYIQGRKVDLNDRHKRLWNKYREKYRRQKGG